MHGVGLQQEQIKVHCLAKEQMGEVEDQTANQMIRLVIKQSREYIRQPSLQFLYYLELDRCKSRL